jgi:hypothetical protein
MLLRDKRSMHLVVTVDRVSIIVTLDVVDDIFNDEFG